MVVRRVKKSLMSSS